MEHINDKIGDICQVEEFKLFLLLYADNQVVCFLSSSLQRLLNDIETYYNIWGNRLTFKNLCITHCFKKSYNNEIRDQHIKFK